MYVINKGLNGLELLSVLVTNNIIGESSRVGFGSAIAVVLLVISVGPIILFLRAHLRGAVMTAVAEDIAVPREVAAYRRAWPPAARVVALHVFLIGVTLLWLFPLLWAVYTSFRPYSRHRDQRLFLDRVDPDPRQLRQRLGPGPRSRCAS